MKTNKSFSKRIKVSKNGKLKTRKIGQGHFNAKASGSKKMKKKRSVSVNIPARAMKRFIKKK